MIALVIFDVDGVLTDGRIYLTETGNELKIFHTQDGVGLKALRQAGIEVAIISGRYSKQTEQRMQELDITHVYQGQADKQAAFNELVKQFALTPEQVAYVGDDLPDLTIMQQVGFPIAVANAVPAVKAVAKFITERKGGDGAAREACDAILAMQARASS